MRIAVLGGGYAGLTLARKLEDGLDEDHSLLVVDEDGTHLVQHELHRVVREPELAEEVTVELDDVLDRAKVVEGRVDDLDLENRHAQFDDGADLDYDVGAVALGAEPATHVEGAREHAIPLKRIEHAEAIHERAVEVLEGAGPRDESGAPQRRIVVAGAGLSGVQVAGELAALARERGAAVGDGVAVTLLEQEAHVAPGFDPEFRRAIHEELVERGVDVRTGTAVERVTGDAVEIQGGSKSLAHDLVVWTGGIAGSTALGGERPQVDARLQLADRTFALGDVVRVVDRDGEPVPATAQAAVREASTVATNVERVLEGGDGVFDPRLERFAFDSPGWLVSVGDGAVAQVGPRVVTGTAANALKATVGVGYLGSVGALREAVDHVNRSLGIDAGEEEAEGGDGT